MPGFPASKRSRRRRSGTIRSVAIDLGIHERTLRRWIGRPELRPHLRAYLHGKQWRLDVPETCPEFERYKSAVFDAVRPFRRKRRKRISPLTKKIARSLGYDGNRRREHELRILRAPIQLKLANAKLTSVFRAKSRLAEETQTDRSAEYILETRILAAKYVCDVFDVATYFEREEATRENKNLFRRMRQVWPTREEYDKASDGFRKDWRERTLNEAAIELAKFNRPITSVMLARCVFLNHDREWAWKANEKQKEFRKRTGESVMLDPYAKRGISLRLFRQRYNREDIATARKIAEGMVRSESETKRDEDGKDKSGYGSQIRVQSNDSEDTQRDKDVLRLEDKKEVKINDPSVQRAIKACEKAICEAQTNADRKALQKYLRTLESQENFWRP